MKDEDKKPEAHQEHDKAREAPKPAPVMDVKPPHATDSHGVVTAPPEVASEPASVKDSPKADIPKDDSPSSLIQQEVKKEQAAAKQALSKPVKPPKQPGSGVGMAIVGTVVIVIVLAALAVYAYLQSK